MAAFPFRWYRALFGIGLLVVAAVGAQLLILHDVQQQRHRVMPLPPSPPPAPSPLSRTLLARGDERVAKRRPFYLVCSPESNGNRFVVALLVSAGCYGRSGHLQPLDPPRRAPLPALRSSHRRRPGASPTPEPFATPPVAWVWANAIRAHQLWPMQALDAPCIVMHRSMPHNHIWVNVTAMVAQILAMGYEPRVLVVLRGENVVRESQVRNKHVRNLEQAEANILRAQRHLVAELAANPDVWFRLVLYPQLGDANYLDWLFYEQMGLHLPPDAPKFDESRDERYESHDDDDDEDADPYVFPTHAATKNTRH